MFSCALYYIDVSFTWCRVLSAKDNTLLRELRHPNILQFLGSIVQGEEMSLITEYLPKVRMFL